MFETWSKPAKIGGLLLLGVIAVGAMKPTPTKEDDAAKAAADKKFAAEAKIENDDRLGIKCRDKEKGSYIGELQVRTLRCGWGKPLRVNTTITPKGTREQWVYGNGSYLYFYDGILVTMQK